MSDLNDLNRPVPTDTEPNVLDTLRAHIIRAATWSGWGGTTNKVAGLMSAVTAAVSGGRSLRLYRRNDGNTADEEVVSLPGVSVGGSAGSVLWANVANRPTAVSAFTNDAGYLASVSWSQVAGRPTAVSAFTNDAGYLTSVSWSQVAGRPTAVSAFTNDAGYLTSVSWSQVAARPTAVSAFTNDSGYVTAAGAAAQITTANVVSATAGASAGGVGTYAFAHGVTGSPGTTAAGSSLYTSSRVGQWGPTLSGTWRCMGHADVSDRTTLWLRIS